MNHKHRRGAKLMWGISVSLSLPEAVSFAHSLDSTDKYYLVRITDNPHAKRADLRERFIVARYPHKGERVACSHAVFANGKEVERVPE